MRVSKSDTICGLAAPTARKLMRAFYDDHPVQVACEVLGVNQDAARDQMRWLRNCIVIRVTRMGQLR